MSSLTKNVTSLVMGSSETSARLQCSIGTRTTDSGRESPIFCSVRVSGKPITIADALAQLARVESIRLSIPPQSQGGLRLRLTPVMSGERCAVAFAELSGFPYPTGISNERIEGHRIALGLLEAPSAPVSGEAPAPKGKGKKTATAVS